MLSKHITVTTKSVLCENESLLTLLPANIHFVFSFFQNEMAWLGFGWVHMWFTAVVVLDLKPRRGTEWC